MAEGGRRDRDRRLYRGGRRDRGGRRHQGGHRRGAGQGGGGGSDPATGSTPLAVEDLRRRIAELRTSAAALRRRPVDEIVAVLGAVGARFLDAADPLRIRALEGLPAEAGVSIPMAEVILDGMGRDWTASRLRQLLERELGDPALIDGMVEGVMALGPGLCVQVVSGSVPGVSVTALLRSLLVKAPTLLKPGRGDTLLPELFAAGLAEEDPELSAALEVVYWPGGSEALEDVVLEAAELVVAYGSDATVASLRRRTPVTARFLGYHHRVGVGVVGREALGSPESGQAGAPDGGHLPLASEADEIGAVAADGARAVVLFEQRGCVCPQLVFVEEGGAVGVEAFAGLVAEALGGLEEELPPPPSAVEEAASLQQLRGTAELHAAAGEVMLLHGGVDGAWNVIVEERPVMGLGGSPRTVRIRPVTDAILVADELAPLGPHLQSVGYEGLGARAEEFAEALGQAGASRVTPFSALSFPPPWWLHDGQGPLRALLRWVELEGATESR